VCLFVRLRISQRRNKIAAWNFACVLDYTIRDELRPFWWFGPQKPIHKSHLGKKLRRGSVGMNWAGNEGAVWWDFGLADGLVNFFITLFFWSVPWGRLSWLFVSFWAHVNIVHRIVSYRIVSYHVYTDKARWVVAVVYIWLDGFGQLADIIGLWHVMRVGPTTATAN